MDELRIAWLLIGWMLAFWAGKDLQARVARWQEARREPVESQVEAGRGRER